MLPRKVSWAAWEDRADEPTNAVKRLVIADLEGDKALRAVEGPSLRHRRWPCCSAVGAIKNAAPREAARTAWEERADGPANIIKHLVVTDPEGGETLGGVEGLWLRHRRWPCCAAMPS